MGRLRLRQIVKFALIIQMDVIGFMKQGQVRDIAIMEHMIIL